MSAPTGTKFLYYQNATVGVGRYRYYLTYDPSNGDKLVARPLDSGDTSHQQWLLEGNPGDNARTMKCGSCSNPLSTSDFRLTWTAIAIPSTEPALWYFEKQPTGDWILAEQHDTILRPPWWAVLPYSPSPILLLHDGRYTAFEIEDVTPSGTGTTSGTQTTTSATGKPAGPPTPNTASSAAPTSATTTAVVTASSGLSTDAKVGIGISIPVGIVALVLLFLVFRRRGNSTKLDSEKAEPGPKQVDDIASVGTDISEIEGRVLAAREEGAEVAPAPGGNSPEQAGPRNGGNGG